MVKSKKRQKKNEDFQKVKLKVGKQKAAPSNSTCIEFKTRALIIPGQTITSDKSNVIKTRRNLTLKELLGQLRHYSAGVRNAAISGIMELIEQSDEVLFLHLGTLMEGILPIMVDEDPQVRANLLGEMKKILTMLRHHHVHPFVALFVVYLTSAMTHIFEDIRVDALKFFDAWMKHFGDLILPHVNQILTNFVGILNEGDSKDQPSLGRPVAAGAWSASGDPTSKMAVATVRVKVFMTLVHFLEIYRTQGGAATGLGKSNPDFSGINWNLWTPVGCPDPYETKLPFSLFETEEEQSGYVLHETPSVLALIDAVVPSMLAFWMEASAASLMKPKITFSDQLQLCASALQLLAMLLQFIPRDEIPEAWAKAFVSKILKHFLALFPFGANAQGDSKTKAKLLEMNLNMIQVIFQVSPESIISAQVYLKDTFAGSRAELSDEQFISVRPALDSALDADTRGNLLGHLLQWCQGLPASHPTRAVATQYLTRHIVMRTRYIQNVGYHEHVRAFTLGLVRYVWELKKTSLETTKAIFQFLRHMLTTGPDLPAATRTQLANGFSVYFAMAHKQGIAYGPFLQLPCDLQLLILDTIYYLDCALPATLIRNISRCLLAPKLAYSVLLRALDVLEARVSHGEFCRVIITVYCGSPQEGCPLIQTSANPPRGSASELPMDVADCLDVLEKHYGLRQRKAGKRKSLGDSDDEGMHETAVLDARTGETNEAHFVRARWAALDNLDTRLRENFARQLSRPRSPSDLKPDGDAVGAFVWAIASTHVPSTDVPNFPSCVLVCIVRLLLTYCSAIPDASTMVAQGISALEKLVLASDAPETHPLHEQVTGLVTQARACNLK